MDGAIDLCSDDEEPQQQAQRQQQGDDEVLIIDDEPSAAAADGPAAAAAAHSQPTHVAHGTTPSRAARDLYMLDCGCQELQDELASRSTERARAMLQQLGQVGATTLSGVADAISRVSCSHCGCLLSAQDALKLLGPATTSSVYLGLAGAVKQLALAQQHPSSAQPQQQPAAPAAAAAVACVELWQELAALQALMLGADPKAAAAATTPSQTRRSKRPQQQEAQPKSKGGRKKKHSSAASGAWAAGTGFGGSTGGITKTAQAAMSAAAQRQAAADAAMTAHLEAITAILQDPLGEADAAAAGPSSSSGVGGKRARSAASLFTPWPLVSVVLAGPLAWLLRLLFQNDSLLDIVGRSQLYSAGMQLLRHVGASTDLLPLLLLPADDPRDTTGGASSSAAPAAAAVTTLLSALTRLEQQAKLYRRSAEQLMAAEEEDGDDGGDEDTTAAVCLALDLSSLVQTLQDGVQMWTSTLGAAGALHIKPVSAAADAAAAPPAATTPRGDGRRRGAAAAQAPAAAAAPPSAAARAAAAQEQSYVAAMQPFRFIEADLLGAGHYFARDAAGSSGGRSAGGEVMRRRLRRITEELGSLATSLPLAWDSSILLAVHADRLDVLRALLLPHPDTPYGGGAFLFDILLPPEYPEQPPKVQFLTTGGGRWRANPNLYDSGKVCLSLLGTWAGPSWEPGVSTLLQVLVSLQSMVFVPDPYFNEPGWERYAGTVQGKTASADYNASIRLGTATHALLAPLTRPDPVFAEALWVHFSHQGPRLRRQLQGWVREASQQSKQQLQQVVTQIEQELDKLPGPLTAGPQQQQQQAGGAVSEEQGPARQQPGWRRRQQQAALSAPGSAEVDVVDLT